MPELLDDPLEATNWGRLLLAAKTAIQNANLPDIQDEKIEVRWEAWDTGLTPPYCIVSPFSIPNQDRGTNAQDDHIYGVMVSIAAAGEGGEREGLGTQLLWHTLVRNKFHQKSTWFPSEFLNNAQSPGVQPTVQDFTVNMQQAYRDAGMRAQFLLVRVPLRELTR